MTLHQRTKKLKYRFTRVQLGLMGVTVVQLFRKVSGLAVVPKIKVDMVNAEGKPFYQWCVDYPESFFPQMDEIIHESAQKIKEAKNKKKRKRIPIKVASSDSPLSKK